MAHVPLQHLSNAVYLEDRISRSHRLQFSLTELYDDEDVPDSFCQALSFFGGANARMECRGASEMAIG